MDTEQDAQQPQAQEQPQEQAPAPEPEPHNHTPGDIIISEPPPQPASVVVPFDTDDDKAEAGAANAGPATLSRRARRALALLACVALLGALAYTQLVEPTGSVTLLERLALLPFASPADKWIDAEPFVMPSEMTPAAIGLGPDRAPDGKLYAADVLECPVWEGRPDPNPPIHLMADGFGDEVHCMPNAFRVNNEDPSWAPRALARALPGKSTAPVFDYGSVFASRYGEGEFAALLDTQQAAELVPAPQETAFAALQVLTGLPSSEDGPHPWRVCPNRRIEVSFDAAAPTLEGGAAAAVRVRLGLRSPAPFQRKLQAVVDLVGVFAGAADLWLTEPEAALRVPPGTPEQFGGYINQPWTQYSRRMWIETRRLTPTNRSAPGTPPTTWQTLPSAQGPWTGGDNNLRKYTLEVGVSDLTHALANLQRVGGIDLRHRPAEFWALLRVDVGVAQANRSATVGARGAVRVQSLAIDYDKC